MSIRESHAMSIRPATGMVPERLRVDSATTSPPRLVVVDGLCGDAEGGGTDLATQAVYSII
jgi:hypothetical protein